MLFKFAIISDEVDHFFREITIDSDCTFLDLNNAILESCGYDDSQITTFYTCSDSWEHEQQIVREDMGTSPEDQDVYIMAETILGDIIEDEGQKLIFTFDPINDRVFYLEMSEIVTGQSLDRAECTKSRGQAPQQLSDFDLDFSNLAPGGKNNGGSSLDLDFDNTEGFNEDEYDPDSYTVED